MEFLRYCNFLTKSLFFGLRSLFLVCYLVKIGLFLVCYFNILVCFNNWEHWSTYPLFDWSPFLTGHPVKKRIGVAILFLTGHPVKKRIGVPILFLTGHPFWLRHIYSISSVDNTVQTLKFVSSKVWTIYKCPLSYLVQQLSRFSR